MLKIFTKNILYSKIEGLRNIRSNSKSIGLEPPLKLQNRRFCVVLKIFIIMFCPLIWEVLRIIHFR